MVKEMKKVKMWLNNAFKPDLRVYKEAKFLKNQGYDVEIICLDRKNEYIDKPNEIYDGIKITRFFVRDDKVTKLIENNKIVNKLKKIIYFIWLLKFVNKTKKYLKDEEYEILHCHDIEMAFCGVFFFRNKKIVFDMHEYYSNRKSKVLNWFIDKVVRYTQKRATWIIHVNDFQVKDIKDREKLVWVPNFPEKSKFSNFKRIKSEKLRISYTGYVRHYIPLLNLIKAADKLENIEVSINGSGDAYDKLKEEEKRLKNFVMTGAYNHQDISKFYANSDLLYVVYNKGNQNDENAFPTKFYEAMITCTPVIVSEGSAMAEFVKKNDIGFIVDGTDYQNIKSVLENILKNKECLIQKEENIRKISDKYVWETIAYNLKDIYRG